MRCAVITPVGPGHDTLMQERCLPSIEAAKQTGLGPFDEVASLAVDDTRGLKGRSRSRNEALEQARTAGYDWIFFLDADDTLDPCAFVNLAEALREYPTAEAVWGPIYEGENLRPHQSMTIRTRQEFLGAHPFVAVQIGCFVKTKIAAAIGFDEDMDEGEDYKFYRALWAAHDCVKQQRTFFRNHRGQHSTGPRSSTGEKWTRNVEQQWAAEVANCDEPVWARATDGKITAEFRLTNPADLIQKTHGFGRFFEGDTLQDLPRVTGRELHGIVDVGANIGNHTLHFALSHPDATVYPVEPNPAASSLLAGNIERNLSGTPAAARVDLRGIGVGVGARKAAMRAVTHDPNNLGATRLVADANGPIPVQPLDGLFEAEQIDLLKIDAEGMEMDVLDGGRDLIARCKPVIWIEVLRKNQMQFAQRWCRRNGYRIAASTQLVNTVDYIAVPARRS